MKGAHANQIYFNNILKNVVIVIERVFNNRVSVRVIRSDGDGWWDNGHKRDMYISSLNSWIKNEQR